MTPETGDKPGGTKPDIRVFIYAPEADPKTMVVDPHLSIAELAQLAGVNLVPEDCAFADPPADEEDADTDHHEPIAPHTKLGTIAGSSRNVHVVIHPCRHIVVTVQYQSQTLQRRFSPARTVGQVRHWALHKLKLNDAATDKLLLQVCGSSRRPGPDVRLGSIVGRSCAVCFDLVPDRVVEG
jgi:hypothetical protein